MRLPELTIKQVNIEHNKRILVTSDIHGNLTYFKKVLDKAEFSDDDILIIVGDFIEKGPESLKTLRYVMEMCEKGNVIPIIGNVDAWRLHMINDICEESIEGFYNYLLSMRTWHGTNFFDELTQELGYISQCPEDIFKSKEKVKLHFKKEFEFLSSLPTVVEIQNYIFVHGGLHDRVLSNNSKRNIFDLLKYDNFMSTKHRFDKYVVVGHWPVTLYNDKIIQCNPIINKEKKIISLDGSCGLKDFGQLNLLVIPEIDCDIDDIYYVSHDNLPLFHAITPQQKSVDYINISWLNSEIKILERGEEFTNVLHTATKRRLSIPNSYIFDDTHCMDYTDYVLPVDTGDMLSIERKTSRGYMAKRNGVLGWYFGELSEK